VQCFTILTQRFLSCATLAVSCGIITSGKKYAGDQLAAERLAQKIKTGGGGVWVRSRCHPILFPMATGTH